MKSLLKLFLTLAGVSLSMGQFCPPPEALSPCNCFEPQTMIVCSYILNDFNLKEVFDNASQFVSDDVTFDYLGIFSTPPLEVIEEGAIEHLKFDKIVIHGNPNLEYLSPRAFNSSRNVTRTLILNSNSNLRNGTELFEFINSFERLEALEGMDNPIYSIPANAFQGHQFLDHIYLNNNSISHIGSRAFETRSANLSQVSLVGNSLPSEGLLEDAFAGVSNLTAFDLRCNNDMHFLERKSFQALLDNAASVKVGGQGCLYNEEREDPQRLFCDQRADWICEKEESYRGKLTGFLCKIGSGPEDIWEYCSGRNGTLY